MSGHFKILGRELDLTRRALRVPHPFAFERVGFMFGRGGGDDLIILSAFRGVSDDHYEPDPNVGARIGAYAISAALNEAFKRRAAAFHIHVHEHPGTPRLSPTDLRELPPVMRPFRNVVPEQPHGLIVLSHDSFRGLVWYPNSATPRDVRDFTIVDAPMRVSRGVS
jgi:hypothetical protein